MTRLRILVLLLVVGCVPIVRGQQIGLPQTVSVQDSGTACSVASTCASFAPVTQGVSLTFSVSGSFSGTLTFEATADGGNWFSVLAALQSTGTQATTTTATGLYSLPNTGFLGIRARATSWSSGTATIAVARGNGNARVILNNPSSVTAGGFISTDGYYINDSMGQPRTLVAKPLSDNTVNFRNNLGGSTPALFTFSASGVTGFGVDAGTADTFKLRTLAQTGYGTLDALGLKVSGVAGGTCTLTTVSHLTVVNGIVTLCN